MLILQIFIFVTMVHAIAGKIYNKCELARELRDVYSIPFYQVGIYTCIAERQSNFNTQAVGNGLYYGLYQMSSEFWCDTYSAGKACGLHCSHLLNDDLTDDLACMQVIIEEHQRISGNGFNAWPSAGYCQSQANRYVQECFNEDNQIIKAIEISKKSDNVGRGKVYDRCELARELRYQHNIPMEQIATWVCIAKHESNFNTAAIGRLNGDGSEDHGLFQISDIYWCGGDGKGCGLQCSELEDNDIKNDVKCMLHIHEEHTHLSGDGFTAWAVYPRCKGQSKSYIDKCFDDTENEILPFKPVPAVQQPSTVQATRPYHRKTGVATGKVYERCELALELRDVHKIPMEQIATWVCIAKHESNFNTSAIGRLNWDGSEDHGLFQISDIYWCGGDGKGCGLHCSELEDNDITNDVKCMLHIHEEHTRLSGDGFTAWAVYPRCKGQSKSYIDKCFDDTENEILPFKPFPAVQQPPTVPATRPHHRKAGVATGKVYERCELALELRDVHKIPMEQIATWVCIAKHESNFNTSAIGRLNWDGSEDHGLFQISDIYWCGETGKACGLQCSELEDNDITNDVKCMRHIHEEHTRLSGNGFTAWTVYNPRCKGRSEGFIKGCFDTSDNEILPFKPKPGVQQQKTTYAEISKHRKTIDKDLGRGKIYDRCELAQELRYKHKIPMEQVAMWVCIAKHESNFNTAAIGRLNSDGSGDHGLFQISDIYWCSPPGQGLGCGLTCADLENNDITDDVECILKIYEEHQFLSGDGFTAWAVYPRCRGRSTGYINGCFGKDENITVPRPAVTQPSTIKPSTLKFTQTTTIPKVTQQPPTIRTSIISKSTLKPTQPSTVKTSVYTPSTVRSTQSSTILKSSVKSSTGKHTTTTKKTDTTFAFKTTLKPTTRITSTTRKSIETSTKSIQKSEITTKPSSNVFDSYFKLFSTTKGKNDINIKSQQQKSTFYNQSTSKAPLITKNYGTTSSKKINEQKTTQPLRTTLTSSIVRSTASRSSTKHITGIQTKSTLKETQRTTERSQTKSALKSLTTSAKSVNIATKTSALKTLKPFNLFEFYLQGYTPKSTPINYQPVQFSKNSPVIKKSENLKTTTTRQSSTTSTPRPATSINPSITTRQVVKDIKTLSTHPTNAKAFSPLFNYKTFSPKSSHNDFSGNRIGRNQQITPHSIEYLLKLTTPRTIYG